MAEIGVMTDPPRYITICSTCDHALFVQWSDGPLRAGPDGWEPRFCAHCGTDVAAAQDAEQAG